MSRASTIDNNGTNAVQRVGAAQPKNREIGGARCVDSDCRSQRYYYRVHLVQQEKGDNRREGKGRKGVNRKRAKNPSQRVVKRQTCTQSRALEDILTPHGSLFDVVISLIVNVSGLTAKKFELTACVCTQVSGQNMWAPYKEPANPQRAPRHVATHTADTNNAPSIEGKSARITGGSPVDMGTISTSSLSKGRFPRLKLKS